MGTTNDSKLYYHTNSSIPGPFYAKFCTSTTLKIFCMLESGNLVFCFIRKSCVQFVHKTIFSFIYLLPICWASAIHSFSLSSVCPSNKSLVLPSNKSLVSPSDDLQFGHSVICSRLLSLSLMVYSFRCYKSLASFQACISPSWVLRDSSDHCCLDGNHGLPLDGSTPPCSSLFLIRQEPFSLVTGTGSHRGHFSLNHLD